MAQEGMGFEKIKYENICLTNLHKCVFQEQEHYAEILGNSI